MHSDEEERATEGVIDLLSLLSSGGITVTVAGHPLLSVDSSERAVDLDIHGAKEAGLRLSDLVGLAEPGAGVLRGSESVASRLSQLGWRLTIYDRGDKVASLGSGVSRLTGHISVNPLRLKGLSEALL
jgi:hypothetical protein